MSWRKNNTEAKKTKKEPEWLFDGVICAVKKASKKIRRKQDKKEVADRG